MYAEQCKQELHRRYVTLGAAIELAVVAHAGQEDKLGRPYILHPLRVMHSLKMNYEARGELMKYASVAAQILGVLHDVVEDGSAMHGTIALALAHAAGVRAELVAVTRRKGEETYREHIKRVDACSPMAVDVKLADLHDHLDETPAGHAELEGMAKDRYEPAMFYLHGINPNY